MVMTKVPNVRKVVVIERGVLTSMANDQKFLREFPFLSKLRGLLKAEAVGSCNTCSSGRANSSRVELLQSVKQTIARMGGARLNVMKKLLNTRRIQITYTQGKRIMQRTI